MDIIAAGGIHVSKTENLVKYQNFHYMVSENVQAMNDAEKQI